MNPYRRYARGLTAVAGLDANERAIFTFAVTGGIAIQPPFPDGAYLLPVETVPVGPRSEAVDYLVGGGLVLGGFVLAMVLR